MTFKKKDANTYQSVTRMSDSTTMVQSSSFPPLNVYNNDMFHTGTNHSNNYNTAADNYTSLERQKQQLLQEQKQQQLLQEQQQRQQQQQQKLLLEQKQRQQQESRQREHQQRLQKQQQQEHQQELQLQSHHHTGKTKSNMCTCRKKK